MIPYIKILVSWKGKKRKIQKLHFMLHIGVLYTLVKKVYEDFNFDNFVSENRSALNSVCANGSLNNDILLHEDTLA